MRLSTHPQRLKTYVVLQQVEYLGPKAKGEKRSGLTYHGFQWPTEEFVPPKSATLDCAYLGILIPRVGILGTCFIKLYTQAVSSHFKVFVPRV